MEKLYIIVGILVTVFTMIPLTTAGMPKTPTIILSILAGIGVDVLIYRHRLKKEKEKAEAQQHIEEDAKRVQQHQLEAGTWVFPVDSLRKKCDANGICDASSEANYQRAKLIAEEILRENNVPNQYFAKYASRSAISAYFTAIQQSKRVEEQANLKERIQQLLTEEREYHAECTRYAEYIGRDKSVQYCQDQVTYHSSVIWQCEQNEKSVRNGGNMLYETGKGRESSWAVHGGIASGIAGGAAGVAVAADVQRKNAQVRQQNAKLAHSIGKFTVMSLESIWKEKGWAEESLEIWNKRLERANMLLVQSSDENKLLSLLHPTVISIENSPTAAVKLEIELHATPNLFIYENVPAVVDGSVKVLLKIGDKIVGTALATLEYEGAYRKNTVSCICTKVSEQAEKYEITFAPHHLWLVETQYNVYDTWTKAEAERVIANVDQIIYNYVAGLGKTTLNELIDLAKKDYPSLASESYTTLNDRFKEAAAKLVEDGRVVKFLEHATYYYRVK